MSFREKIFGNNYSRIVKIMKVPFHSIKWLSLTILGDKNTNYQYLTVSFICKTDIKRFPQLLSLARANLRISSSVFALSSVTLFSSFSTTLVKSRSTRFGNPGWSLLRCLWAQLSNAILLFLWERRNLFSMRLSMRFRFDEPVHWKAPKIIHFCAISEQLSYC